MLLERDSGQLAVKKLQTKIKSGMTRGISAIVVYTTGCLRRRSIEIAGSAHGGNHFRILLVNSRWWEEATLLKLRSRVSG